MSFLSDGPKRRVSSLLLVSWFRPGGLLTQSAMDWQYSSEIEQVMGSLLHCTSSKLRCTVSATKKLEATFPSNSLIESYF